MCVYTSVVDNRTGCRVGRSRGGRLRSRQADRHVGGREGPRTYRRPVRLRGIEDHGDENVGVGRDDRGDLTERGGLRRVGSPESSSGG